MSLFREPDAGMLIAIITLILIALLFKIAIAHWEKAPVRKQKAFDDTRF